MRPALSSGPALPQEPTGLSHARPLTAPEAQRKARAPDVSQAYISVEAPQSPAFLFLRPKVGKQEAAKRPDAPQAPSPLLTASSSAPSAAQVPHF